MLMSWLPPREPREPILRYLVYQRKQASNKQRRFERRRRAFAKGGRALGQRQLHPSPAARLAG